MSEDLALIGLTGSRAWPDPQLLEDTLLDVWHDALQIGYTGIEYCTLPKCRTARPHNSHGTADCIRRAEAAGIPVRTITA